MGDLRRSVTGADICECGAPPDSLDARRASATRTPSPTSPWRSGGPGSSGTRRPAPPRHRRLPPSRYRRNRFRDKLSRHAPPCRSVPRFPPSARKAEDAADPLHRRRLAPSGSVASRMASQSSPEAQPCRQAEGGVQALKQQVSAHLSIFRSGEHRMPRRLGILTCSRWTPKPLSPTSIESCPNRCGRSIGRA